MQLRQGAAYFRSQEIGRAVERTAKCGPERNELLSAVFEEGAEIVRIIGRDRSDLFFHVRDIGCGVQPCAVFELQTILWIQTNQIHLAVEVEAASVKDFTQWFWIQKERWTGIERDSHLRA